MWICFRPSYSLPNLVVHSFPGIPFSLSLVCYMLSSSITCSGLLETGSAMEMSGQKHTREGSDNHICEQGMASRNRQREKQAWHGPRQSQLTPQGTLQKGQPLRHVLPLRGDDWTLWPRSTDQLAQPASGKGQIPASIILEESWQGLVAGRTLCGGKKYAFHSNRGVVQENIPSTAGHSVFSQQALICFVCLSKGSFRFSVLF